MNLTRPAVIGPAAALLASLFTAPPGSLAGERAAQLEDLRVVREQYMPKELAYAPANRELAQILLERLEKRAGEWSEAEFVVGLARLGALTDNAHSGLRRFDARAQPRARLPVRLLWFEDALVVARATGPAADLAGARVVKVEGRSASSLFEGAKVLLGGNPAARRHWLPEWIESAGILHALGLAQAPDQLRMTLVLADGRTVERTLPMVSVADLPPAPETARLWSPEPIPGEVGWHAALPLRTLPLYLQDASTPFRLVPLPDLQALYVQLRSNEDEKGFPIARFLAAVRERIAASPPRHLVVDLRFDVGGNITTTLEFSRWLPGSVAGRTYLLVGPYTFSAGIISAAAIRKHGGERVTVVGEGIGDRLHFWSEGAAIQLPNSLLHMRYADGQFNLRDGCTGESGCVDDLFPVGVNFAPLQPDIHAPLGAAAWLSGRDPAMERIAIDIATRRP